MKRALEKEQDTTGAPVAQNGREYREAIQLCDADVLNLNFEMAGQSDLKQPDDINNDHPVCPLSHQLYVGQIERHERSRSSWTLLHEIKFGLLSSYARRNLLNVRHVKINIQPQAINYKLGTLYVED